MERKSAREGGERGGYCAGVGNTRSSNGRPLRVAAVVHAGNEWPLLGVAILHVLRLGFDEVVVLDHASTDETPAGLVAIASRHPGRLRILRSDDPAFRQESATAVLIEAAIAGGADWVYVFDADEFLLIEPASTIHELLAAVPVEATAVRYEVHNWIAPNDFDDTDLFAYRRLKYRALADATLPARIPPERRGAALASGELHFFQFPFKSKLIVRAAPDLWLGAGSHDLRWPVDASIANLPPQRLRAAHLPLLSARRVAIRDERRRFEKKLPEWSNWHQVGLSDSMASAGRDAFWLSHSVRLASGEEQTEGPSCVIDETLAEPIGSAAEQLASYELEGACHVEDPTLLAVAVAVAVAQRYQRIAAELVAAQAPPAGLSNLHTGTRRFRARTVTGIRQVTQRLRAAKYRGGRDL